MITVLIVVHLMIVLALVAVVLLQRSEGGALGIGGGGGFFSSRGTANVLTRTTAILAGLFFITSLSLTLLAHVNSGSGSILQQLGGSGTGTAIPNNTRGDGKGILDTLRGNAPASDTPAAPAAPAQQGSETSAPTNQAPAATPAPAPSGPQVPNSQ